VRFQKLMWRNMMRSTKSQKASILYYNIDLILDVNVSYDWTHLSLKKKKKSQGVIKTTCKQPSYVDTIYLAKKKKKM
jgi:hypothetical protein